MVVSVTVPYHQHRSYRRYTFPSVISMKVILLYSTIIYSYYYDYYDTGHTIDQYRYR